MSAFTRIYAARNRSTASSHEDGAESTRTSHFDDVAVYATAIGGDATEPIDERIDLVFANDFVASTSLKTKLRNGRRIALKHEVQSDDSSSEMLTTNRASHRVSARWRATTSKQMRELRLCDVFQLKNFSTAPSCNHSVFTTLNQVF
jgi:hypothetical protein